MTRGAHVLAGSGRVVGDSVSSSSSPNSVSTCRWCLTFLLLDEKSKYSFITFIFFMIDVFVRKKNNPEFKSGHSNLGWFFLWRK